MDVAIAVVPRVRYHTFIMTFAHSRRFHSLNYHFIDTDRVRILSVFSLPFFLILHIGKENIQLPTFSLKQLTRRYFRIADHVNLKIKGYLNTCISYRCALSMNEFLKIIAASIDQLLAKESSPSSQCNTHAYTRIRWGGPETFVI